MTHTLIQAATQIALSRYAVGELSIDEIHAEIERQARLLDKLCINLANDSLEETFPKMLPAPAVPIAQSVTKDFVVCLEDGGKFKMLKRHLRQRYGMTPDQYRQRWGLPPDYPMTAPAHSQRRSAIAKLRGLGTHDRGSCRQQ